MTSFCSILLILHSWSICESTKVVSKLLYSSIRHGILTYTGGSISVPSTSFLTGLVLTVVALNIIWGYNQANIAIGRLTVCDTPSTRGLVFPASGINFINLEKVKIILVWQSFWNGHIKYDFIKRLIKSTFAYIAAIIVLIISILSLFNVFYIQDVDKIFKKLWKNIATMGGSINDRYEGW
jgi:hypothetical protein